MSAVHTPRQNWTDDEVAEFLSQLQQVIKWTEKLSDGFDFSN